MWKVLGKGGKGSGSARFDFFTPLVVDPDFQDVGLPFLVHILHDHDLGKTFAVGVELVLLVGDELFEFGMAGDAFTMGGGDEIAFGFAASGGFDGQGILESALAG